MASEEDEDITIFTHQLTPEEQYLIAIDPIDGSSNIEVGIPIGSIFSILRKQSSIDKEVSTSEFLQAGKAQVAAGYVLYGSSTILVYASEEGVNGFTYDPAADDFFLSHPLITIPDNDQYFSVNEAYSKKFSPRLLAFIESCKSDSHEKKSPLSARYTGSLVADFHRNLLKGGVFLYPAYTGNKNGKLRLLYECNPLAFIAKKAGGKASNGHLNILDIKPESLHQRSPLFIGSAKMVTNIEEFLSQE